MNTGIMEWTAIEAWEAPVVEAPEQDGWYSIYFRNEYFGKLPEELLPKAKELMALTGGFDYNPEVLTLVALHRPEQYVWLCRALLNLLTSWMKAQPAAV